MSDFRDVEEKAEYYVEKHPEQADKRVNEVASFVEDETDYQHDQEINRAVDTAEQRIGQGQNEQDDQDKHG